MTIQRISGSPVAMYAFDLNSSIFTEDGEFIYYGPYQLYMSGVSDVQVKSTLEHRSKNPGIFEDDMFLSNDPWVGAAHQMDVTLLAPVFHAGKLFCWITDVLHQYDVGGITPGSFCPNARDAFDEGILIPPIKIVERGELRRTSRASTCGPRANRTWSRSISAPRSPATTRPSGASSASSSATAPRSSRA